MEVRDDGKRNPTIVISADEVAAWLRTKADEAGFADRAMNAVQINVAFPFTEGAVYHGECPSLVAMVSNIPNSR